MYTDKTMTCRDCGMNFTFTTGEQEFYASKGFTNEPSRCPDCRGARTRNRNEGGFSSGGYSGGGASYGGGYERPQREMFPAVCAECGKETQVPFQPRGDRPVYCSDCFATQRGNSAGGGGNSRGSRY
ncbi:MAG: zinc-binding protein [Chloroflexi bacterium]|nr:zinc-binding protein [Chloroflexota bacterium]